MDAPCDDSVVAQSAANRVFATPELLEKIMSNLHMVKIFTLQRVNRSFYNIFNIAPFLLRTKDVRANLRSAAPPRHVETFTPFINGLKTQQLLIRPFHFNDVRSTTHKGETVQVLSFCLHTSLAKFAEEWGTIMGRAGASGQDYSADDSWGHIAIATSSFIVSIEVHVQNEGAARGRYESRFAFGPSVTKMRDLFKLLEGIRDRSNSSHEKRVKARRHKTGSPKRE